VRVTQPILIALTLTGCGMGSARHPHESPQGITLGATPAPNELPVVLFRLLVIRSWSDPWYVIESEDVDLTLPAALAMGIPAELWIKCAIENPAGFRQEIYWVRPLRC
jgi:hypothetical protein